VRFTADVADADSNDTLSLCVEVKAISAAFTNTEDLCGSTVAYSGSAVAAEVTRSSLVNGTEYHWQVRTKDAGGLYSSWTTYGGNSDVVTAARDVGIDTTAPTTGTVYDGSSAGVDTGYNNGSLSDLSANWSGFSASPAGLDRYEYSIGTTAGGTNIRTWTSATTSTSVNASSLTLRTSQSYFFNVRMVDTAGNTSSVVSSNGQLIAPTLTFSATSSITLANLRASNSYTSTANITLTTSTNAYNGYVIRARSVTPPTKGATTMAAYGSAYASPTVWSGTGFGYTSNDTTIQALGDHFAGATKFAAFSTVGSGDIVADHTAAVTGTPITSEVFTLTYRVTAPATQQAGTYQGLLSLTAVATY
jgi:hypothetical protein